MPVNTTMILHVFDVQAHGLEIGSETGIYMEISHWFNGEPKAQKVVCI